MQINIRRGMNVPVEGEPEQVVQDAPMPDRLAVVGLDYPSLQPSLAIAEGDAVDKGQILFTHRTDSRICVTAPASGRIVEINRGPRRSIVSVVIQADGNRTRRFPTHPAARLATLDVETLCSALLDSGLWTGFKTRPGARVPPASTRPAELFVTAMDTEPLAPDPEIAIAQAPELFSQGLAVLSRLTTGTVYLCAAPDARLPVPDLPNLVDARFAGPHPAGLPGTHMHFLGQRGARQSDRWQVGYQDVIAIGHLFATGELPDGRVVALAGPAAVRPRLVRAHNGISLNTLLHGEARTASRVISGSVLSGRETNPATHYLGRFHNQIALLPEASKALNATGMLAVEAFERVWPFDVPPLPLLRALLIRDAETAQALGCLDLEAEDLALCSYVCPARLDYGGALEETHAAIGQPT